MNIRLLGAAITFLGLAALMFVGGRALSSWLTISSGAPWHWAVYHVLLSIATQIEWPLAETAFAGLILWWAGRRSEPGPPSVTPADRPPK